jgi:hypothetical protein
MFLETSAKTGENVEEAFLKCSKTILAKIETGMCFRTLRRADHSSRGVLLCVCMCVIEKVRKGGQRSILDYKHLWMNDCVLETQAAVNYRGGGGVIGNPKPQLKQKQWKHGTNWI